MESNAVTSPDIQVQNSIEIMVSPDTVFTFWQSFDNFSKFMKNVREVRTTGANRFLWKVSGPVGSEVSWEAEVTEMVPHERIAWASVGDAQVQNQGHVAFASNGAGGTTLSVVMRYEPPAGKLGHAIATLFGVNPEQQMDEDLQRCKNLIEKGAVETAQGPVLRGEVQKS